MSDTQIAVAADSATRELVWYIVDPTFGWGSDSWTEVLRMNNTFSSVDYAWFDPGASNPYGVIQSKVD